MTNVCQQTRTVEIDVTNEKSYLNDFYNLVSNTGTVVKRNKNGVSQLTAKTDSTDYNKITKLNDRSVIESECLVSASTYPTNGETKSHNESVNNLPPKPRSVKYKPVPKPDETGTSVKLKPILRSDNQPTSRQQRLLNHSNVTENYQNLSESINHEDSPRKDDTNRRIESRNPEVGENNVKTAKNKPAQSRVKSSNLINENFMLKPKEIREEQQENDDNETRSIESPLDRIQMANALISDNYIISRTRQCLINLHKQIKSQATLTAPPVPPLPPARIRQEVKVNKDGLVKNGNKTTNKRHKKVVYEINSSNNEDENYADYDEGDLISLNVDCSIDSLVDESHNEFDLLPTFNSNKNQSNEAESLLSNSDENLFKSQLDPKKYTLELSTLTSSSLTSSSSSSSEVSQMSSSSQTSLAKKAKKETETRALTTTTSTQSSSLSSASTPSIFSSKNSSITYYDDFYISSKLKKSHMIPRAKLAGERAQNPKKEHGHKTIKKHHKMAEYFVNPETDQLTKRDNSNAEGKAKPLVVGSISISSPNLNRCVPPPKPQTKSRSVNNKHKKTGGKEKSQADNSLTRPKPPIFTDEFENYERLMKLAKETCSNSSSSERINKMDHQEERLNKPEILLAKKLKSLSNSCDNELVKLFDIEEIKLKNTKKRCKKSKKASKKSSRPESAGLERPVSKFYHRSGEVYDDYDLAENNDITGCNEYDDGDNDSVVVLINQRGVGHRPVRNDRLAESKALSRSLHLPYFDSDFKEPASWNEVDRVPDFMHHHKCQHFKEPVIPPANQPYRLREQPFCHDHNHLMHPRSCMSVNVGQVVCGTTLYKKPLQEPGSTSARLDRSCFDLNLSQIEPRIKQQSTKPHKQTGQVDAGKAQHRRPRGHQYENMRTFIPIKNAQRVNYKEQQVLYKKNQLRKRTLLAIKQQQTLAQSKASGSNGGVNISVLDDFLLVKIFSKLNTIDILMLQFVCKRWYHIIWSNQNIYKLFNRIEIVNYENLSVSMGNLTMNTSMHNSTMLSRDTKVCTPKSDGQANQNGNATSFKFKKLFQGKKTPSSQSHSSGSPQNTFNSANDTVACMESSMTGANLTTASCFMSTGTINVDLVIRFLLCKLLSRQTFPLCLCVEYITVKYNHRLTDKSLDLIAQRCPELKYLCLRNCSSIRTSAVANLVSHCENLKYLDLTGSINVSNIILANNFFNKHNRNALMLTNDMSSSHATSDKKLKGQNPTATKSLSLSMGKVVAAETSKALNETSVDLNDQKKQKGLGLYKRFNFYFTQHRKGGEELKKKLNEKKLDASCENLAKSSCSKSKGDLTNLNEPSDDTKIKFGLNVSNYLYLEFIDLSYCSNVNDICIQNICKSCIFIKNLYLRRCRLLTDLSLLYISKYCANLKELSMCQCMRITDQGVKYLANERLTGSSGSNDELDAMISETAAVRNDYANLIDYFAHSSITKSGSNLLLSNSIRYKIKYLSLAKCPLITDKSLIHLCKMGFFHQMKYLNLRGCTLVTDKFVKHFTGSQAILKIKFQFQQAQFKDTKSEKELANLEDETNYQDPFKNTNLAFPFQLKSLDLSKCSITDKSIEYLCRLVALEPGVLQRLSLRNCEEITDRGIKLLALNCKHLQHLNVTRCPKVTTESLNEIKKNCKRCLIQHTNITFA